ncbi:MAG: metal ABC transporter substrate-binding protein [Clostridia bacterium]|nr:metal ABC transporter substrate-binding protein [Clostridia bacterium]
MKKTLAIILALVVLVAAFAGCGKKDENVITVGASSTPHAEILEQVKDVLKEQGYTLDIVVYDDYVLPNTALEQGDLDANYFQHTPYLNSFNESNGTHLASAALIHYEPFGLYGNGVDAVSAIPAGATILVPADDSNETRALLLLQQEGLITLPADASVDKGVTTLDIVDSKGYNVVEIQAEAVPAQLKNSDKGTVAVINGNYAIAAGLKVADALAIEDASGNAAQTYANIIAVKQGNENSDKIKALIDALKTDAVKKFIEDKYAGAVVAIF